MVRKAVRLPSFVSPVPFQRSPTPGRIPLTVSVVLGMLPGMEYFRRHIVQRAVPLLAALVLCSTVVAGFDHNHGGHFKGTGENPCCACNLDLLLAGCDGAAPDLHPSGAPYAFLAPDLPTCPLPGNQFQFLACGLRAPPAA